LPLAVNLVWGGEWGNWWASGEVSSRKCNPFLNAGL